jgi:hypothetical protein
MGRRESPFRKKLVEECEVIAVSQEVNCLGLGITMGTTSCRNGGQRRCFRCPGCGRPVFKLYRPPSSKWFGCRKCHDLTYYSVRKHDVRLDRLIDLPDRFLVELIVQDHNMTWKLLAIRAGYIKLGLMGKY